MIVALGAADGQSKQRRGDNFDRVSDDLVAHQVIVIHGGRSRAIGTHAKKAGGDEQFARVRRGQCRLRAVARGTSQFVAGELLGDELVERLVGIEGADDIIAILVSVGARRIRVAVAVRVSVARDIEPVAAPAFAVMR